MTPPQDLLTRYDAIIQNETLDQLLPFLQSVEKKDYEVLKRQRDTLSKRIELILQNKSPTSPNGKATVR
ncbi:MAG: hypothetical protein MUE30_02865 [Spirosomaceae bacterium]|nr:hypothetical protein [Spirosomataceae bacterium]